MNEQFEPDDRQRGAEMVSDADLHALFARRRPDAARFAAGVAERIGNGTGIDRAGGRPGSRWRLLDRAASVMPGLADGGLLTKSWATVLSLPTLLLLGTFAMFVRSNRRLEPALAAAAKRGQTRAVVFTALLPTLGSLLGIVFMALGVAAGGSAVADIATLLLLLSMAALTFQLGSISRTGRPLVAEVGGFVVALQSTALFGCVLWVGILGVFAGDSTFGYTATGWVLGGGMIACSVLTMVLGRAFAPVPLFYTLIAMFTVVLTSGIPDNSVAAVRTRLASIPLDPAALSGWGTAGRIAWDLERCGEPTIDWAPVQARIEHAIDEGVDAHPTVWTVAAQRGLLDETHWHRLAERRLEAHRLASMVKGDGPLGFSDYQGYLLPMLLATRDLGAAQRDRLVERIDASWPDRTADYHGSDLGKALLCIEWLEQLGRNDRIEAKRPWLHELLREHWVSEGEAAAFSPPGGFTGDPESHFANAEQTSLALAIIARVGAPPTIPLRHVRAFLRGQVRHSFLIGSAREPELWKLARADRYLLENGIGLPTRGPLETLLGERAMIAALLLALLSMRAIWIAARRSGAVVGAMP
ncbi:MAG: hypothetical protein KDE27_22190 [Planctomycetes bacterium]|nr:hypothetical protein [Planctomycetota bacterium]